MKKGNIIVSVLCAILGTPVARPCLPLPHLGRLRRTGAPPRSLADLCIRSFMLLCAVIPWARTLKMKPEDDEKIELWTPGTRRVYISMLILVIYTILSAPPSASSSPPLPCCFTFIQWFGKKKDLHHLLLSPRRPPPVYFAFKHCLMCRWHSDSFQYKRRTVWGLYNRFCPRPLSR